MHVVVMGCGRVGSTLALRLAELGHSVAVIDQDPNAFRRLGAGFRGSTVAGLGFDQETLAEAEIERADAFAAVSNGDNSNIIAARVARETFNVTKVVARIYDFRRAEIYERLGIPTVATVPWTANRLLQKVLGESTIEQWRDPSGRVALVALAMSESWIGQKVGEIEQATGSRVALITRFGLGELPTPSTVLQDGDVVHVMVTDDRREALPGIVSAAPDGA
ncbi:MAG: potassium channel family protein [Jatrophihabitans sp.]